VSVIQRERYWLEGASATPFFTRRKIVTAVTLGTLLVITMFALVTTKNVALLAVAIGLVAAVTGVLMRRDASGGRWVTTVLLGGVRRALARQGRWDEFDPDIEEQPFWLSSLRILGVSSTRNPSRELALLDHTTHLVAVLEVDGGGQAIQTAATHVRRERAFSDVLRNAAQAGTAVSQLDWITRCVPADPSAFANVKVVDWVTQAVENSMRQLAVEASDRAQDVRSWVVLRMPVAALADKARDLGLQPNDEVIADAAYETVGQFLRLLADQGIAMHRGMSPRRLAAVIRAFLQPQYSVDDMSGIERFWDAWPAFAPSARNEALAVFNSEEAEWFHASGSIPRSGWPVEQVQGRWLADLVLTDRLPRRVVMTSFELIPPHKALAFARDQLTTAAAKRIRQRKSGQVSTGELEVEEGSARTVGQDITVRRHAGVRTVVRVMVSAETPAKIRRAKEEAEAVMTRFMGVTEFWWDDDSRHTLGVLATLPLGQEFRHD